VLLLIIMGPTTLVGMAVLVLFLPLVKFVMTRMLVIRRERVQMTDQRVNIVNAMLQGVRTEVCDALCASTKSSHAV
jgi:hypothetical protein